MNWKSGLIVNKRLRLSKSEFRMTIILKTHAMLRITRKTQLKKLNKLLNG